jgi:hypothetical protein
MNIEFNEREIDWLNNYAGTHELSIEATVRMAVRMFSLVEGTPGAREWLAKQASDRLGPKYEPMPPLPELNS